jgi:hypothetical protein
MIDSIKLLARYTMNVEDTTLQCTKATQIMDSETDRARQLHVEMLEDNGELSFWPESFTLKLIKQGKSNKAIDEQYRQLAWERQGGLKDMWERAYNLLTTLRGDYGRCATVKEETVLEWLKIEISDEEIRDKYREIKKQEARAPALQTQAERIYTQMIAYKASHALTVKQILAELLGDDEEISDEVFIQQWKSILDKHGL